MPILKQEKEMSTRKQDDKRSNSAIPKSMIGTLGVKAELWSRITEKNGTVLCSSSPTSGIWNFSRSISGVQGGILLGIIG